MGRYPSWRAGCGTSFRRLHPGALPEFPCQGKPQWMISYWAGVSRRTSMTSPDDYNFAFV